MGKNELIEEQIRQRGPDWYRASVGTAAVAALFSLAVGVLLGVHYVRGERLYPLQNPQLEALKTDLQKLIEAKPADQKTREAALRARIRTLDRDLRAEYAGGQSFALRGVALLLGGIAVFLVALRYAILFRKRLPAPAAHPAHGVQKRMTVRARWAVGVIAAALFGAGAAAGLVTLAPQTSAKPTSLSEPENWPRFRGPDGSGISTAANVPTDWDGPSGRNILWTAAVPLPGQNSPVVWGNRVFLSGADEKRRAVYCFDADSGALLWRHEVKDIPDSYTESLETFEATGYAAPTMVTDGRRAFALFANGDLVAVDFDGRRVWGRSLGKPSNQYGHASSLLTHRGRLIVQYDQGMTADEGLSSIMALDGATGMVVWDTKRPVRNSWSTPIVIRTNEGDEQIVATGAPWVIAYNPLTGDELWRADCLAPHTKGGTVEVAASPVYAGGLVYVCNDQASLAAIRPDGRGDVSATHVLFRKAGVWPDTSSPLCDGKIILLTKDRYVTCCDAKTGDVLWEHEFETMFSSSPSLVGDMVYFLDQDGVMHLFKANAKGYEAVGEARLFKQKPTRPRAGEVEVDEETSVSPAFVNGRIYIRGETREAPPSTVVRSHLFCIGVPHAGK